MRTKVIGSVAGLALLAAVAPARAYDTDAIRGYLGFRVGGPPVFTQKAQDDAVHIDNEGHGLLAGAVLGVNLSRHWGIELAGETNKTGLTDAATDRKTAEWAWWTILVQGRWRYRLLDDRLTPYALAGLGVRIAEVESKASDSTLTFGSSTAFTGAVGAGLEYFVMNNVSLGMELKYIVGMDNQLTVSGEHHDLSLDAFIYTFGIRVFYPQH